MYRKKPQIKFSGIRSQYYIINAAGDVVGRVPISTEGFDSIRMDYWLKEEYQGKGIGTVAIEEIIKQIFVEKEFDDLVIPKTVYSAETKTVIENIVLEIPFDNEVSRKIAMKNGFKEMEQEYYTSYFSLTLEDYIKQTEHEDR